jgi:hypothetical protein
MSLPTDARRKEREDCETRRMKTKNEKERKEMRKKGGKEQYLLQGKKLAWTIEESTPEMFCCVSTFQLNHYFVYIVRR